LFGGKSCKTPCTGACSCSTTLRTPGCRMRTSPVSPSIARMNDSRTSCDSAGCCCRAEPQLCKRGDDRTFSVLFDMSRMFERFVAASLRRYVRQRPPEVAILPHAGRHTTIGIGGLRRPGRPASGAESPRGRTQWQAPGHGRQVEAAHAEPAGPWWGDRSRPLPALRVHETLGVPAQCPALPFRQGPKATGLHAMWPVHGFRDVLRFLAGVRKLRCSLLKHRGSRIDPVHEPLVRYLAGQGLLVPDTGCRPWAAL